MLIVTIRGQLGSGAPEIGKMVAKQLNIDYVDREIIAEVAARLNYPEKKIEAKEMPAGTLAGRIAEALNQGYPPPSSTGAIDMPAPMYLPAWNTPLDDPSYLEGLAAVINKLAEDNSIVIRGRGSQFILKDNPAAFHVMVVADMETRLNRVMADLRFKEKAAKQEINRFDNSRREFIKRYFKADLEDLLHYDLVISTEHLSFEDAALIIVDALVLRNHVAAG